MTEYVCRKHPKEYEDEWDDNGNYLVITHLIDAETVIEAAMGFYYKEGDFPDEVADKDYDKVLDRLLAKPARVEDLEKMLRESERRLSQYVHSRQQSIKAAQEMFHQSKVALLAVNTSSGTIRR